jgi:hypothetical protein
MTPSPQPAQPATAPGAPDWAASDAQIECPLCEYNLRGLTDTRCPECGYTFTWTEVLNPNRQRHPYLFEHHPEAPFISFFKTLVGTLRPRRFWRSLHPSQPSKPARLLLYFLIIETVALLPLIAATAFGMPDHPNSPQLARRRMGWSPSFYQSYRMQIAQALPRRTTRTALIIRPLLYRPLDSLLPVCIVAPLAWPLLTFLLLSMFRISISRARLRANHLGRCVIYSADIAFWPGLPLAVLVTINAVAPTPGFITEPLIEAIMVVTMLLWLVMTYRLVFACAYYLRFRHAAGMAISTQVILFIIVCFALFVWGQ